jgi:hypothetical protein
MAWGTPTDAKTLIGARFEFDPTGVGAIVGVIDVAGRREAVA